jgi:misacylated tRNA(Ala) deacylase
VTTALFREDAYRKSCEATVTAIVDGAIMLDSTVFYPEGGGQPGDRGTLRDAQGRIISILDTRTDDDGAICHIVSDAAALPAPGTSCCATLDWDHRYRHMRTHTCLHLLCSLIPFPVTGGSISQGKGRLDFDMAESVDKITLERALQDLIDADLPVGFRFITDEEMAANMDLVRTMAVAPPLGQGQVRLVEIDGTDVQPCGGTHVARTGEIGVVRIGKIEKKGRHNRRINLHLD